MTPINTPINHDELLKLGAHAEGLADDALAPIIAAVDCAGIDGHGFPKPDAIEVARIAETGCGDLIVERQHLADALSNMEPGVYTVSLGHMTREAFDNLPEFEG